MIINIIVKIKHIPFLVNIEIKSCTRIQSVYNPFLPTYRQCVKYSPNDGEQKYRSQMVEEQSVRHEVSSIQNNGRQHVEEERVGGERRHVDTARLEQ